MLLLPVVVIAPVVIPAAVLAFFAPAIADDPKHILLWVCAPMIVAAFLMAGVSQAAMSVKRAHDLGRPGSWMFRPFSGFKLLFSEGEPHDNQYGLAIR
jgi:uncharacterized membrane protein YhaH (DUF805 family)